MGDLKHETWLDCARLKCGKGKSRELIKRNPCWKINTIAQGTVASDGYRVHFVSGENVGEEVVGFPDAYRHIVAGRDSETIVSVSREHLFRVCKAANAVSSVMQMKFNNSIICSAADEEVGSMQCEIVDGDVWLGKNKSKKRYCPKQHAVIYQKQGPDTSIEVNPQYLKDAVWGMEEIVELRINSTTIHISSGIREAVILLEGNDDL